MNFNLISLQVKPPNSGTATLLLLRIILFLACALPTPQARCAAEETKPHVVYVNNRTGSPHYDGSEMAPQGGGVHGPCATIRQALDAVAVSGRIVIADTGQDYYESVRVDGLGKGRAANPLVIEGSGARVNGLVRIRPELWTAVGVGVFYYEFQDSRLFENFGIKPNEGGTPSSNWLNSGDRNGWFNEPQAPQIFFLNGNPGPNASTLKDLPAGGFFLDIKATPWRLYFRPPVGVGLSRCDIQVPIRNGVFVNDDYVVVRNLCSVYSSDDGFDGFWGIGDVFENCNGSFNCDQGISLHGTSSTIIDGGLFERNGGCGIADVMTSVSLYRNVVVRDNLIFGAYLEGLAHVLISCRFSGNYGCQVAGGTVNMVNCLIIGTAPQEGGSDGVRLAQGQLDHCTIVDCKTGYEAAKNGSVTNSIFAHCSESLIKVRDTAADNFRLHNCWLNGGKFLLGPRATEGTDWPTFVATARGVDGVTWGDLGLRAPNYSLPEDSPYGMAGDYKTKPGAVLPLWTKWAPVPVGSLPLPHPHP